MTIVEHPVSAVPILLYHSIAAPGRYVESPWQVRAADFAADMEAVAQTVSDGRRSMTATDHGAWLAGELGDARPILVTFDDGFADYVDVALPILRSLGISSTIFVTTGYLDRPRMLSRSATADLVGQDGVEVGGHTVTHPHLDTVPLAHARREIDDCRRDLEDMTGTTVRSFAYPHGSVDAQVRRLVVGAGYEVAHAVKNALSHPADDPFALGRFTVTAATSRAVVRAALSGEGLPLAWTHDRVRTRAFRIVRRARRVAGELTSGRGPGRTR